MWHACALRRRSGTLHAVGAGLADDLLDRAEAGMLLLADRGFYGFEMWMSELRRVLTCCGG